ncbi:MAG: ABC transporter ATP-binding protein [Betaproteobacteria bacterium]|nr:ABC transporter ATP-binding protein [Betaproteobacteria bacterium]
MTEALRLDALVKRFGGLVATDHVTLSVAAGGIHALIGPNGAGKTTLIHQISGALRSDEGTVTLEGHDITALSMHERVRAGLARSYQLTSLFRRFSVADNLALAVQARTGSSFRFWRQARFDRAPLEEAARIAARIDLSDRLDVAAGALAHGEQRRLEIGLALATRPRVLLLDEPLAGLGPEESARMVTLVSALRGECTLLLVEHDMDAVFRLADRISVLVSGKIVATGTPAEIRTNAEVKRAYLGDELDEPAALGVPS